MIDPTPYKVYNSPPKDFVTKVEVAGCYCECAGKVLLMRRHPDKPQGTTWGVPAGKLEEGEDPLAAVLREVYEETGLTIDEKAIKEIGRLWVRYGTIDFIFHMFHTRFETEPEVVIGPHEHEEARWLTVEDALNLHLIAGGAEALNAFRKYRDRVALKRK